MGLGGPSGLIITPHVNLNLDNLAKKSLLGYKYGFNVNIEEWNLFLNIENGNHDCVG